MRCLLLCKDRNFKANHNFVLVSFFSPVDVCYSAKIGILKQITTALVRVGNNIAMFVTLQR